MVAAAAELEAPAGERPKQHASLPDIEDSLCADFHTAGSRSSTGDDELGDDATDLQASAETGASVSPSGSSAVLPAPVVTAPTEAAGAAAVEKHKKACGGSSKGCSGCSQAPASSPKAPLSETAPVTTSTFELFKVGIGPSSSHTVGPLVACRLFAKSLSDAGLLSSLHRIGIELCGSLALTGIGHYTNKACVLGLTGIAPSQVDTNKVDEFLQSTAEKGTLMVGVGSTALGEFPSSGDYKEIDFSEERDVTLFAEELPLHPNGMICQAFDKDNNLLQDVTYYSIGGGFVNTADELVGVVPAEAQRELPLPFGSMAELVKTCAEEGKSLAEVMRANEEALRPAEEVEAQLAEIWRVMEASVDRGLDEARAGDELPGPLGLVRRAPDLYKHAKDEENDGCVVSGLMDEMRWLDCYALAVMEENACMGQVVTAPTNGASGVVPATLTYYMRHLREKQPAHRQHSPSTFLLAAASAGILAKEKACISGAAGGCQAEVGTASAMAAAGLCAALGGTAQQVSDAAEIAMEHSLGMTCDPVLGLVQVPCIERNTMGATKALNAVSLVMRSPVTKRKAMLGYDDVLRVMKETGKDMSSRYRETAQGGLALDYESSLQLEPEKWAEVQQLMGVRRIKVGPRVAPRKITYEEVSEVRRLMSHLDLSMC